MLKVENLSSGYRKHRHSQPLIVAEKVSFSVPSGKLILLAGRNGIGKSTLIKTLAGLHPAMGGNVEVKGQSLFHLGAESIAGLVSVMFSTPPELALTKTQDLVITSMQRGFSTFRRKLDKEWAAVRSSMEKCNALPFWDRDFASLSDGEKQKVMLARCLAQDTPVLMLDEPLAFLDYPSRREMLVLLETLCREENKTILYSSHDLEIALQHCDYLLLLETHGCWRWYENTQEIRSLKPASLFKIGS